MENYWYDLNAVFVISLLFVYNTSDFISSSKFTTKYGIANSVIFNINNFNEPSIGAYWARINDVSL